MQNFISRTFQCLWVAASRLQISLRRHRQEGSTTSLQHAFTSHATPWWSPPLHASTFHAMLHLHFTHKSQHFIHTGWLVGFPSRDTGYLEPVNVVRWIQTGWLVGCLSCPHLDSLTGWLVVYRVPIQGTHGLSRAHPPDYLFTFSPPEKKDHFLLVTIVCLLVTIVLLLLFNSGGAMCVICTVWTSQTNYCTELMTMFISFTYNLSCNCRFFLLSHITKKKYASDFSAINVVTVMENRSLCIMNNAKNTFIVHLHSQQHT